MIILKKKGLFKTLYIDKAGIFGGPKRCNFSQVQRAYNKIGIEIIFTNSPQVKGNIERLFDTFQDRLFHELRLQNINNRQNANHYLQNVFLPGYWQKNIIVNPENATSEFITVPENINLDNICIQKEYRQIRNDHTFSYGNKFYLIEER